MAGKRERRREEEKVRACSIHISLSRLSAGRVFEKRKKNALENWHERAIAFYARERANARADDDDDGNRETPKKRRARAF